MGRGHLSLFLGPEVQSIVGEKMAAEEYVSVCEALRFRLAVEEIIHKGDWLRGI